MYCNWLLQKITLSRSIELFQNCIWCLKALCREGSFSTTHPGWHAVCKTITMRCRLIFVPTLVLSKCEYNSLGSHTGNHGFYQGMSVVGKQDAYSLHMSKRKEKKKRGEAFTTKMMSLKWWWIAVGKVVATYVASDCRIKRSLHCEAERTVGFNLTTTKHGCALNWFNFTHCHSTLYVYEKKKSPVTEGCIPSWGFHQIAQRIWM